MQCLSEALGLSLPRSANVPACYVRDRDEIFIDIPARKLGLKLSDEEIRDRLEGGRPVERGIPSGFMRRYVKLEGSTARGAVRE